MNGGGGLCREVVRMKVTPLEIRQQQFPLRFRGLDPGEVDKFLEWVASEMEELMRENARLRESLVKGSGVGGTQKGEDELKKAFMTIQQIREEWVGRAEKQAEQVLLESSSKPNSSTWKPSAKLKGCNRGTGAHTSETAAHLAYAPPPGRAPQAPGWDGGRGGDLEEP